MAHTRIARQFVCDCWGCGDATRSADAVRAALQEAIRETGVTLLELVIREYEPEGVTGVAVVSESHLAIHTWPERDYVAFDAFTCGDSIQIAACERILRDYFRPETVRTQVIERGPRRRAVAASARRFERKQQS